MRGCGILMHVSSLPGPLGIGCFGKEAYDFVDFLEKAKQSYWQVLPLTPPARGNSPYSSYSVFASNPYFIDLTQLVKAGLLSSGDLSALPRESGYTVDFAALKKHHKKLLYKAFCGANQDYRAKTEKFREKNGFWVEDYALFMALKEKFKGKPYYKWDKPLFIREPAAMKLAKTELAAQMDFWVFVQYLLDIQWKNLKKYANKKGVKIIGDMPIYADTDSCDCWANPKVFMLDSTLRPTAVAGVPPDLFSETGQLWGNPVYNWGYLKRTGYKWWLERMGRAAVMYDIIRIDHFRALESFYAIPPKHKTAERGTWKKGPGIAFLDEVAKTYPKLKLIAEDLGILTPGVERLLRRSGLPGMKILLFAFDPKEESSFLPHNHIKNCVAYTGTHDNDTVMGWMKSAPPAQVKYASKYFNLTPKSANWAFIRGLYQSVANTVIVQAQDVLGLDNDHRMNIPGVPDGNWSFRVPDGALTEQIAKKLAELSKLYGRAG